MVDNFLVTKEHLFQLKSLIY